MASARRPGYGRHRQLTGRNNPINSQHPGGALVLMGDGSAKMLKNETDMVMLKRYAVRDDRLVISDTVNSRD